MAPPQLGQGERLIRRADGALLDEILAVEQLDGDRNTTDRHGAAVACVLPDSERHVPEVARNRRAVNPTAENAGSYYQWRAGNWLGPIQESTKVSNYEGIIPVRGYLLKRQAWYKCFGYQIRFDGSSSPP
jgi:hypothetical protein